MRLNSSRKYVNSLLTVLSVASELLSDTMVVWEVEPEQAKEVGAIFASFREVSHCYQRPSMPGWPYRLFTMIHAPSRQKCTQIAEKMAEAAGVKKYDLLYTEEELKKTTMAYFGESED